ncbi:hypothetical protein SAMN05216464_11210 [Mucilaginibacter pineti]|uniref:Outer membrane protein beta-barrel domain-containing protein n=1 Tax=Mucilaginibacter pineti TaxID=1391627 RepID=A0A1G7HSL0_9SPHI|nr:hypothetical protein [Mucilaginibacter pineti]SDF03333.1 hypothetical protein SAMN05216464_11210 [Mucilaginibacter pineti]
MKTMTKMIAGAFTAAAIFIGTNVNAQTTPANTIRFGVGLEVGAPTGNAHDVSNFELGGTARLQYGVSNDLALTLTSGYYNFFGKTVSSSVTTPTGTSTVSFKGRSLGMIPVKAGIKAFVGSGFYFSGEVGAGFEVHPIVEGGQKDTKLILSPGVGYATKSWDVGVRYENYSGQSNNYGLVGLRLAYGFGL